MRKLRRFIYDRLYELGEWNAGRVKQIGEYQREGPFAQTTRSPQSLAREKGLRARGQKLINGLKDLVQKSGRIE